MPKRKRDQTDEAGKKNVVSPSTSSVSRQRQVQEKIYHGKKVLHRVLKLAKGFERQKLGRRHKSAVKGKDEAAVKRLDAEIEALKTLDLAATAEAHLHKTLLKEKAISESPALPPAVASSTKPTQDVPTANITARLYNSNPVKEAMPDVVASIRLSMGIMQTKPGAKSKVVPKNAELIADNEDRGSGMPDLESATLEGEDALDVASPAVGFLGTENEDDDAFATFDDRLASSEDEVSADLDLDLNTERIAKLKSAYILSKNLSLSPSPSLSPSNQSEVHPATKKATGPAPRANATFLPSLTMGGYFSGSESEAEGMSDLDVAPRKNRRGQRARQQIWEKKYGKGAKHVKNQPDTVGKDSRDDGWDMKRGAQEAGAQRGRRYEPAWKKGKPSAGVGKPNVTATGENAIEIKPKVGKKAKADVSKIALHPSWEAAKRAKEKKVDSGAFAGRKVVFD